MNSDVAASLTKSAAAFRDIVWPNISAGLGGGDLVPVESVASAGFVKDLDVLAGVDAWQLVRPSGIRPLASRVQAGWGRMNTFTIRWSLPSGGRTEIDKRIAAIRDGYLYPAVTVQAYLDCPRRPAGDFVVWDRCRCASWADHPLLSVAHIDTVALYEFADAWRHRYWFENDLWRARDGAWIKDVERGNRMLVIRWKALPDAIISDVAA